ncbi:GNAT family N-acetyltransferase [Amycolatopsis sp. NPDC059027]|uniref:GNAT family N-acetyltransferase n=1 Tax=unclassified Amycolatopsis TaxID=2618356 RepID=UPI003670464A
MTAAGQIIGDRVRLRPAGAADAVRFEEILSHPEVARWWADAEEPVAEQVKYLVDPEEDTSTFAIEFEGATVGVVLAFEKTDPQYRHAGIDIALHPDWQHRGLGADAIRTLALHLFTERGHHRLVIDPAAENEQAIRLYKSLGFRPVGTMRRYERGSDGTWHDGLLMDLLADDLAGPEPDDRR